MGSEKELLEAFENVIHEDFPNPKRIGCPGHEALLTLVDRSKQIQHTRLLAHIRQCAPCFDELKELRCKAGNQSRQDT
jgi:hypothetical protein